MKFNIPDSWFENAWKIVEPQLLKSVEKAAKSVDHDYEVVLTPKRDRNGRPVVLMVLQGPGAFASELKHGHLMKAVAYQGCDVHRYGGGA